MCPLRGSLMECAFSIPLSHALVANFSNQCGFQTHSLMQQMHQYLILSFHTIFRHSLDVIHEIVYFFFIRILMIQFSNIQYPISKALVFLHNQLWVWLLYRCPCLFCHFFCLSFYRLSRADIQLFYDFHTLDQLF